MASGSIPTLPIKGSRLASTLFFSVFFLMGLGFEILLVRQTATDLSVYSWRESEAVITSSQIIPPRDAEHDPVVKVGYTYVADGKRYESTQIETGAADLETRNAYQLVQRFTVGVKVPCWFDPNEAGRAVLQRKNPAIALIVLFPLIFVAVGAIGIWSVWRTKANDAVSQPISARAKAPGSSRTTITLVSLFALILGAGVGYPLFVQPLRKIAAAQGWVSVPGEVVASRVRSHRGDKGRTYSVDVVYRYTFQGHSYLSNRYNFSSGSSSGYEGKAEVVHALPAGRRISCFVDPANPTESVLERGIPGIFWFGLIPVLFIFAGAAGLVSSFRMKAAGAAAPAYNPFTATSGATTGPGLPVPDPAAGPLPLTPAVSPKGKLVGLLVFALFWNGIVSVFVTQLFKGGPGGISWFLALFLLPFVAVGIGLVGGVFYYLMALFNPRPRVTLSQAALLPGEAATVRWQLAGNTGRLRRLQVTLEGREETTYRRGTDTRTDKEVFARIQLTDTADPLVMQNGSAPLQLPPGAIHSFDAPHNKIIWSLKVTGEIPRWPDVTAEYPVTVAPAPLVS